MQHHILIKTNLIKYNIPELPVKNVSLSKDFKPFKNDSLCKLGTQDEFEFVTNLTAVKNTDILIITKELVNDYNVNSNNSEIKLITNSKSIVLNIDSFLISNAINNLIDNAVKYGGDKITLELVRNEENIIILISDSGTSLEQKHKNLIFEKFYRVSSGNVHDIKGYGIGLYYSKEIIEKHNGTLDLELKNDKTTFKIILPNE